MPDRGFATEPTEREGWWHVLRRTGDRLERAPAATGTGIPFCEMSIALFPAPPPARSRRVAEVAMERGVHLAGGERSMLQPPPDRAGHPVALTRDRQCPDAVLDHGRGHRTGVTGPAWSEPRRKAAWSMRHGRTGT